MDERGKKKIVIKGIEDKREITTLLAVTLSGALLPPQLLYEGKTEWCHPHVTFPTDWDIFHTDNHWSNSSTVLRFFEKVLNPYLQSKHVELELPPTQKTLVLLDVFRAHHTTEVLQKLAEANILAVFIPPNCTDKLQPLDLSVNKSFKNEMRKCFVEWYSNCVAKELISGKAINEINIGLKMSIVKPLSANWLISAFEHVRSSPNIICNGFKAAEIFDILNMNYTFVLLQYTRYFLCMLFHLVLIPLFMYIQQLL